MLLCQFRQYEGYHTQRWNKKQEYQDGIEIKQDPQRWRNDCTLVELITSVRFSVLRVLHVLPNYSIFSHPGWQV